MGRRRALETQDLVAAAARVFERRGYADATLDDIAAEAGVSKPTVYQYVSSKQRLLETIVEQAIYPLRDGIEQIVASPASTREKLEAYVRLHVNAAIRYKPYYVVLMADQHQLSPQALRGYQSWAREVNHTAEQLLRQGIEEVGIDIVGHPTFLPLTALGEPEDVLPVEWQERFIEMCVKGRVAIEINESYRVPHREFLVRARERGALFSVGSDTHGAIAPLERTEAMIREAGLDRDAFLSGSRVRAAPAGR